MRIINNGCWFYNSFLLFISSTTKANE